MGVANFLCLCVILAVPCQAWDYLHNGYDWEFDCRHEKQSPIDIRPAEAMLDTALQNLTFTNYDISGTLHFELLNTGHTLEVKVTPSDPEQENVVPQISSGGLSDTYQLVQFHFHWGKIGAPGSEHTIDGKHNSLELHMVHRNTRYSTLNEAIHKEDGLAVLGILFYGAEQKKGEEPTPWIKKIVENIPKITTKDNGTVLLPSITFDHRLSLLLPKQPSLFYRYHGSLTTPPCKESVSWTVFHQRLPIALNDLDEFRELVDVAGGQMQDNRRNITPTNNRTVFKSFILTEEMMTAGMRTAEEFNRPNIPSGGQRREMYICKFMLFPLVLVITKY